MARKSKDEAQKTRTAIIKAARELFEIQGFSETTVSQIVNRAGITKGALFHYFKTKEELFREIWEELQREMDEEARVNAIAARSETDPYAAFLAGCRTYLRWVARPDYRQIVLVDGFVVLGLAGWYEADNDIGRSNVLAGISYLAEEGIVAEHRVPALAVLVHNALSGAGMAIARGEPGVTDESVLDAFEAVLKSLR